MRSDGEVLAQEKNAVAESRDPTAHAEITAIRQACARLGRPDLRGATLYSTLQPCGMCTMAAIWAKIGRIVYGAGRSDVHRMYFEARHVDTLDFVADAYRDDITWREACFARNVRGCISGRVTTLQPSCRAIYEAEHGGVRGQVRRRDGRGKGSPTISSVKAESRRSRPVPHAVASG